HSICSIGFVVGVADPLASRRRLVTPAAASELAGSSPTAMPASAARAAIVSSAARCGLLVPPSHRFTVAKEVPRRVASCSWVRLSFARIARSVAGTISGCKLAIDAIFVMEYDKVNAIAAVFGEHLQYRRALFNGFDESAAPGA